MKIKTKLIILLLAISLIPILSIVTLTRISVLRLSSQISDDIQNKQLNDFINELEVNVHNYKELIKTAGASTQFILKVQAQEVEKLLAKSNQPEYIHSSNTKEFGLDNSLATPQGILSNYPTATSLDYQGLFFTEDAITADIKPDLARLQNMTQIYHWVYLISQGNTLWHYTTLDNGIHTSYPGGGTLPPPAEYDPRIRPWYLQAQNNPEDQAPTIGLDAVTKQIILTFSKPIYRPDGQFAGVTAIDKTMENIFSGLLLPEPIEKKNDILLVALGEPETTNHDKLLICLHNQTTQNTTSWKTEVSLPELSSSDKKTFSAMLKDIKNGLAGNGIMPYKGVKSLWIYSDQVTQNTALIIIIPFDVVTQLAEQTQKAILDENINQQRQVGVLVLIVLILAIALSIRKAKTFTTPINKLADAANRLADGDYSAKADINTGDELQQLAEIFKQIGPKLLEHEKSQRGLALARSIQQNLLPKNKPELTHFDIAGRCQYCDETGGDYFDFISLKKQDKGNLGIALGDVSGHGIGAALLMASAKSILRCASDQYNDDLPVLMAEFNNQLSLNTGDDKFITLFYGILNDEGKTLSWASGGHDPAIWYHHKDSSFEELPNTGPLMGCMEDMQYGQAGPITFDTGDILLIGTDGIWETQNQNAAFYGTDRLREEISKSRNETAEQIAASISASVESFAAPNRPADDVTLIVIKAL